jgi:hypothetical protein
VVSTVNVVTHEHIGGIRNLTAFVKQLQQVVELTMDVTANCNWGRNWLNIALFNQDFLNLFAKNSEIAFGKHFALFF